MSQQQHPRLRPVDFPMFPSHAESTAHDTAKSYHFYVGVMVEADAYTSVRMGEEEDARLAAIRFEP